MKLINFEPELVRVVIAVSVMGKPIEASDDGALSMDSTRLKLLERTGNIRWTIEIEPDGKKTVTYRYQRYVPSE